jgi:ATP-dependent Clp protease ATP-binding subunit ClpB
MLDRLWSSKKPQGYVDLDPELQATESSDLERGLLKRVVGQDRAVKKFVRIYQTFKSGLNAPGKPLGVLLFLGPTGSGKTRLVEALAEYLFGDKRRMIKLDCGELQHDHEVAKIIGSPPGYLGHDKTAARVTQEELDKWHRPGLKFSILLFDEIEKAADAVFQLMLGMMEGRLTLGNNKPVDLSNTLIVLTSNIGQEDMQKLLSGSTGMGFTTEATLPEDIDQELWNLAKGAIEKKFSAEFINRLTQSIVFHVLDDEALKKIVNIELDGIQDRILSAGQFILLRVEQSAKDYLRKEGTNPKYGARELNRTIEKLLVEPTANLLATKQLSARDMLLVTYEDGKRLRFQKLEGVVDPPPPPQKHELSSLDPDD